ncbi:hypothetical protein JCM1840_005515 [Sporobolomyces johnsonii]
MAHLPFAPVYQGSTAPASACTRQPGELRTLEVAIAVEGAAAAARQTSTNSQLAEIIALLGASKPAPPTPIPTTRVAAPELAALAALVKDLAFKVGKLERWAAQFVEAPPALKNQARHDFTPTCDCAKPTRDKSTNTAAAQPEAKADDYADMPAFVDAGRKVVHDSVPSAFTTSTAFTSPVTAALEKKTSTMSLTVSEADSVERALELLLDSVPLDRAPQQEANVVDTPPLVELVEATALVALNAQRLLDAVERDSVPLDRAPQQQANAVNTPPLVEAADLVALKSGKGVDEDAKVDHDQPAYLPSLLATAVEQPHRVPAASPTLAAALALADTFPRSTTSTVSFPFAATASTPTVVDSSSATTAASNSVDSSIVREIENSEARPAERAGEAGGGVKHTTASSQGPKGMDREEFEARVQQIKREIEAWKQEFQALMQQMRQEFGERKQQREHTERIIDNCVRKPVVSAVEQGSYLERIE